MSQCRRVLLSATASSRQLLLFSSTRLPRQTNVIIKQAVPAIHRLSSSSFSTSVPRLNKAGVVFNVQDTEDFQKRVMESQVPVVVDFHATWCGPCKILGPRIEKQISSKNGKVMLAKVDIDDLQDLAIKHGVNAVPTVIAVQNGKVVDTFVGNLDDDVIKSFVNKLAGE